MKQMMYIALILAALLVATCGAEPAPTATTFESPLDMPNPASKYCVDQGYKLEIRTEAGGEAGYCLFPDGSECEEWAFFRGECAPAGSGDQRAPLPAETQPSAGQLANPASQNCVEQGGALSIQKRGDGGEYGICLFEDNRQCEEWALLRGNCLVGGVKITGYGTPAAQYCAITGGQYAVTGKSGMEDEQGTCTFKNGQECDVWDYFNGKCSPSSAQMANPASQNCIEQGGTLSIQKRGDGGEYGICLFEDNRQCEEWALLRGNCPVGGVKITGYLTPAAQYCAIAGGQYAVTGKSGMEDEEGTCSFKNGQECDVWDYFNGKCSPSPADTPAPSGTAPPLGGGAGQIVFSSDRGGDYGDLYVMNVDGSDVVRLTEGDSNSFAGPWSPDGTRIAYTSFGLTKSDVSVINADGTGQKNLTNLPDAADGFPAWSPDGQQIAFTSRRDGNNEIYLMNADGSDPTRLTDNPTDDFAPTWSPDGSQIAFVSDREQAPGVYDIYIMDADGSELTRLTDDEAIDYSPDWSPDGARIVFRSHHDGPADIYVINVDGTGLQNLTEDAADDWAPTWSPDGTQIAFQTERDGNWEIYAMKADGTDPMNLTDDPADDQLPYWRP